MTKLVVLIPGTMGSELFLRGRRIWPPTVTERFLTNLAAAELLDEEAVVGDVIRQVGPRNFYADLIDLMSTRLGYSLLSGVQQGVSASKGLAIWPYDWRQDLRTIAFMLGRWLDYIYTNRVDSIYLLAHSMGGLIARLLVEDDRNVNRPWFAPLRAVILLGTPHRGAPLALKRILGLENVAHIPAGEVRRLCNDPRYPSAYQLLPPPQDCYAYSMKERVTTFLDPFSGALQEYDLEVSNLQAAFELHNRLARGRVPPHVRYFNFATLNQPTVCEMFQTTTGIFNGITIKGSGDGVVPIWSSILGGWPRVVVRGAHSNFFHTQQFRTALAGCLEEQVSFPESGSNDIVVTVKDTVAAEASFSVVLEAVKPVDRLDGRLVLEKLIGSVVSETDLLPEAIHYAGPALAVFSFALNTPLIPGTYRVKFIAEREDYLSEPFVVPSAAI